MSEDRGQTWAVYALIAANVAMFAVEIASGADAMAPSPQVIIGLGGNYPPLTLHGQGWRLASSMFLHFGVVHIAMNMLCLYQARIAELVFGRVAFLVIYLIAGLGGGVASLIVNHGNIVTAGASGAVFGIYGALGTKLILHRARFEPEAWAKMTRRLGTFFVINTIIGLSVPGISISAHVGGAVIGAALGAGLLVGASAERRTIRRALGFAALGVALTAGAVMAIDDAGSTMSLLRRFDAAEAAASDKLPALDARYRAGELSSEALADAMEREVIAQYRQLRDELRAARDVPEKLRPLFARIDELMTARLAAWQAYTAAGREADPDARTKRLEQHAAAAAEVTKRLAAFNAEAKALKARR